MQFEMQHAANVQQEEDVTVALLVSRVSLYLAERTTTTVSRPNGLFLVFMSGAASETDRWCSSYTEIDVITPSCAASWPRIAPLWQLGLKSSSLGSWMQRNDDDDGCLSSASHFIWKPLCLGTQHSFCLSVVVVASNGKCGIHNICAAAARCRFVHRPTDRPNDDRAPDYHPDARLHMPCTQQSSLESDPGRTKQPSSWQRRAHCAHSEH